MRPKICLATDSVEPSGVGEHMLALAGELRARYAVVLACPESPGGLDLLARAASLGLGIKRLDGDGNDALWLARGGFALMHVHAGIGWEGHGLAALARAAGIGRIVRTEHLPDVITDPDQRQSYEDALAGIDRVICVSAGAAETFRDRGLAADKLVTIRNGLPVRPARRPRAAVRAALGVAPDHPVLLTVARFTAQKDHATLLAALPEVLRHLPHARLWLAGTGPLEEAMRDTATGLDLEHAVQFLGNRPDVPDLMAAADVLVLPSRFEGLPLAVLEAMAASLPVVATRIGGTDEAVVHGETGWLVTPGDPDALTDAILHILRDPAAAKAFGAAGRQRFADAFTAARMAAETAALYTSLGVVPGLRVASFRRQDFMSDPHARTRIGFIGAGGIAHRHLGVLEGFPDVEIAAFADTAEDRAREAAARFGARAYPTHAAMLEAETLDALYICVPPFAHGAPERAAIEHNLPFFVEKPLSVDLALAEAIGADVEAAGLVTGVGYHWRYLDTVDEARGLLSDNPAQFLSGYWLDSTPPPAWWWRDHQSGGQITEQTTHIVDLARYLVGEVVQVFGLASHKARGDFPELDVATASTASLRFASGAIGNIGSTCLLRWNHRVGLHIFGDGLALEMTDHDIMVDVGRGRPVRHAEGDPVWREDRDFIDAVRGGENRIRCPYGEALKTLRITDAIRRSARTGQAIDLSPATTASHAAPEPIHV